MSTRSKRTYAELLQERNELRREVARLKADVAWHQLNAVGWQAFAATCIQDGIDAILAVEAKQACLNWTWPYQTGARHD